MTKITSREDRDTVKTTTKSAAGGGDGLGKLMTSYSGVGNKGEKYQYTDKDTDHDHDQDQDRDREEYGGTDVESNSVSISRLIPGLDSDEYSSDYFSKY